MNSLRAGLVLTIVMLGVLLLGLTPYPRDFAGAMRQAETHRAAREYGAALEAYRQAARSAPHSPQPWLRMGEILLAQQRFMEAGTAFREAEFRGGGGEALLGLGKAYAGRGDWAAALKTWFRALSSVPDEARIYAALGQGVMAQGQFEQAAHYLVQALELEPSAGTVATVHALLGRLLVVDDPLQAADHFRQAGDEDMLAVLDAASAEPDVARRNLLLGISFLQRDELALARRHFERAVGLAPDDAEAHAYLGHTLDRLGQTVDARAMLNYALELDPDSVLAYYFLGRHHRLVGNTERAQAALWEALVRDPKNAGLRIEMAETFVKVGDYAQAGEWYQGAVETAPEDVEFHLLLAHFYLDHLYQVEQEGLPVAEAVVDLAPDDARAHDLLGWALYLVGQPVEAHLALVQALALDPDLVSAHYHLGVLYAGTGRGELARQHLRRAADLDREGYYRDRAEALLKDL